ncbi:retrotransposon protein, putative, ty1-copia subclass [Tanacetum coccineum]
MFCLLNMRMVYFKKAATPQVMVIQSGRIQKSNKKLLNAKGKGKGKGNGKDKSYIPKPYAKEHPAKDDTCHHCKETRQFERRNRTLLDMVRSRMNLTTLPLSFWDHALETATHILNMVSTKKVDKTPYELWYGKVPNLSYLKVRGCEALVKRDMPDKL